MSVFAFLDVDIFVFPVLVAREHFSVVASLPFSSFCPKLMVVALVFPLTVCVPSFCCFSILLFVTLSGQFRRRVSVFIFKFACSRFASSASVFVVFMYSAAQTYIQPGLLDNY